MGGAVGVVQDGIPGQMRPLFEVCERLKAKIAEYDAALIESESKKMFKGHAKIVDELTARTKHQIRKLIETIPSVATNLNALIEGGNHYAKFIKMLGMTKAEIEIDAVKTSTQDFDEELLVSILGTSTIDEIKEFDEFYIKEKMHSIVDIFSTKTKEDSSLKKFVSRIMQFDREESKSGDRALAENQVQILHKAGASRLIGVEEEPIIEILATASRTQCALINEVYQEMFKMKLERAINIKFKGSCGRLMVMWTQPPPHALVTCISYLTQKMLVDKNSIGQMLARFDKDYLQTVDEACTRIHQKSLADLMSKGVGGTYHRALKCWIESASPDKGFERILELYVKSKFTTGKTVEELLEEPELVDKFQFLLEKQGQELKLFTIAHKIKLDANESALLVRNPTNPNILNALKNSKSGARLPTTPKTSCRMPLSARTVEDEGDDEEEGDDKFNQSTTSKKSSPGREESKRKFTIKLDQPTTATHEDKHSKVYNYLVAVMESRDPDGEGSLDETTFWGIITGLPLTDFGLTKKDIDAIRNWSDWDSEGRIYYYEALFELADNLIKSIENKEDGDTDPIKVIKAIKDRGEMPVQSPPASIKRQPSKSMVIQPNTFSTFSERKTTTIGQFPTIPLYFRQYLMDTISAFDYDCNGVITQDEVEGLITTFNITSLTLDMFLKGGKSRLSPKEVADTVCKEIEAWFSDEQEHYICLVDKSSGAYFWYNTLDESTQWADAGSYGEAVPTEEMNATTAATAAAADAKEADAKATMDAKNAEVDDAKPADEKVPATQANDAKGTDADDAKPSDEKKATTPRQESTSIKSASEAKDEEAFAETKEGVSSKLTKSATEAQLPLPEAGSEKVLESSKSTPAL